MGLCKNCGAEIEVGFKFCSSCGSPVPQTKQCVRCGAELSLKMAFCPECGANQNESVPASGINIGAKSVIAGDVVNTTNITNNIEIQKTAKCGCCNIVLNGSDYYTCSVCGEAVCADCYIPSKKKCKKCDNRERNSHKDESVKVVSSDGSTFYSSIKDAIEDSVSGHVIKIKGGVYSEYFIVDKNISIEAYDENIPVIKLDGINSITISSVCKFSKINFTTEEGENLKSEQGVLYIKSGNVSISDCNFKNCSMSAIHTKGESSVLIDNCSFEKVKGNPFWIDDNSSLKADNIKLIENQYSIFGTSGFVVINNFEISKYKYYVFYLKGTTNLQLTTGVIDSYISTNNVIEMIDNTCLEVSKVDFKNINCDVIIRGRDNSSITIKDSKIHDCNIKQALFGNDIKNDGSLTLNNSSITDNKIGNALSCFMNTNLENVLIERNVVNRCFFTFIKGTLTSLTINDNQTGSLIRISNYDQVEAQICNLNLVNNHFNDSVFDLTYIRSSILNMSNIKIKKSKCSKSIFSINKRQSSTLELSDVLINENNINGDIFKCEDKEASKSRMTNVRITGNKCLNTGLSLLADTNGKIELEQFEVVNNEFGTSIVVLDWVRTENIPICGTIIKDSIFRDNELTDSCILIDDGNTTDLSNIQMINNKGNYGLNLKGSSLYPIMVKGNNLVITGLPLSDETAAVYVAKNTEGNISLQGSFDGYGKAVINNGSKDELKFSLSNNSKTNSQHSNDRQDSPKELFDLANKYLEGSTEDIEKAVELFIASASNGYGPAIERLGDLYFDDDEISHDYKKALNYYQTGADLGFPHSQKRLAKMYEEGWGGIPDSKKSFEWKLKAAEQGDVDAQEDVGYAYYCSDVVEEDLEKAKYWLKKAIENGSDSAGTYYGYVLDEESERVQESDSDGNDMNNEDYNMDLEKELNENYSDFSKELNDVKKQLKDSLKGFRSFFKKE